VAHYRDGIEEIPKASNADVSNSDNSDIIDSSDRNDSIVSLVWYLFSTGFNAVPDDAWVCLNTLVDVLGPLKELKKELVDLGMPYRHSTSGVKTDELFTTGGPVKCPVRGRPRDAQEYLLLTQEAVSASVVTLMRNVKDVVGTAMYVCDVAE
jgi:hypothetical protein